jgi:hypothetical protein
VKAELEKVMTERQALYLAREKANLVLADFNKGETAETLAQQQGFTWMFAKDLSRQPNAQLPAEVLQAAFSIPYPGKSAIVGTELPNRGSALIIVDAVHPGTASQFTQAMSEEFVENLTEFKGIRDFNFYVAQAKEKAKVTE